jgi:hypothetical protein
MMQKGNTMPLKEDDTTQILYAVAAAFVAGAAHLGRMMYENKPVPPRKLAGSLILTLCVGGALGALGVSRFHMDAATLAAAASVTGFIGGPVVLGLLARIGKRELEKKAGVYEKSE